MKKNVRTCSPGDSIEEIMSVMTDMRIRHIPVLDNGQLAGIVSIGDAVKHRIQQIELEKESLSSYIAGSR